MSLSKSALENSFKILIGLDYPDFIIEHVVEQLDNLLFVLTGEGDIVDLGNFCGIVKRDFKGSVILRRQSNKTYQLEVTIPTATERPSRLRWCDIVPWIAMLIMILGVILYSSSGPFSEGILPKSS